MKKRLLIFAGIIGLCGHLSAQTDTTVQRLEAIEVVSSKDLNILISPVPLRTLNQEQLQSLPVLQVSDALKFLPGTVIKDYGGVGGLKTVTVRGFGPQHTGVAYDGAGLSDSQTGQVDLGKIPLDNVEKISLTNGICENIFLPARFFSSASLIHIQTSKPVFSQNKPANFILDLTAGSFGLVKPTFRMENRWKRKKNPEDWELLSSVRIDYLTSTGNYPYTQFYGGSRDSTSREKRKNSDIQSISTEANIYVGFRKRSSLTAKLFYYYSERGLPGATILYNENASQRLWDENLFGHLSYKNHFSNKFAYQANLKINYARQRYLDPDYLNMEGKLDNRYIQREAYLSNSFLYTPHRILSLSAANDLIYQNMSANIRNFIQPDRFSSLTVLAARISTRHIDINAHLLHTLVFNNAKYGGAGKNVHHLSPMAGFSVKPFLKKDFRIRFFYQNIFRIPTFNDLYYREIGNLNLLPENTHQFNLGFTYGNPFSAKKIKFTVTADFYYNLVKDKIVAIPTQNLFVWSMLNFGKVNIGGIDIYAQLSWKITDPLTITMGGNYSFQHAVDVTDATSKTYLHQIPYTPEHSGTAYLNLQTPWVDLIYTIMISGKRYSLQQNTSENLLDPYTDQSIGLQKEFNFGTYTFHVKAELLNLAGTQYEVIRNFPMQGRSFRISMKYSF